MEFTVGRRMRRHGRRFLGAGLAGAAGIAGWFMVEGVPGDLANPLFGLALCALSVLLGVWEFARLRKPFRLVVDAFGVTTHDAALSWAQVDAVAFHYPEAVSGEDGMYYPDPLLTLRPVAGVTLPRKPDRTHDGYVRYTLVDTHELDQSISDLVDVLARYGGARFEAAPRSLRPPTPVTVADPERSVPGGEQVFSGGKGAGIPFLTRLGVTCVLSVPDVVLVGTRPGDTYAALWTLWLLGTFVAWGVTIQAFRRWRRPLRLRIGPGGIGMREFAAPELYIAWSKIAAVTVGPRPRYPEQTHWLVVWLIPGAKLSAHRTHLLDGHQAHVLVRLDRLAGGEDAVVPVLRAYAGERFSR